MTEPVKDSSRVSTNFCNLPPVILLAKLVALNVAFCRPFPTMLSLNTCLPRVAFFATSLYSLFPSSKGLILVSNICPAIFFCSFVPPTKDCVTSKSLSKRCTAFCPKAETLSESERTGTITVLAAIFLMCVLGFNIIDVFVASTIFSHAVAGISFATLFVTLSNKFSIASVSPLLIFLNASSSVSLRAIFFQERPNLSTPLLLIFAISLCIRR